MKEVNTTLICDSSIHVVHCMLEEINKIIEKNGGMSMRSIMSLLNGACGQLIAIVLTRNHANINSEKYKEELKTYLNGFGEVTVELSKNDEAIDSLIGFINSFDVVGE